jgi:hypothetical protein
MADASNIRITLTADQYRDLLGVLDMGLLIKESVFTARQADALVGKGEYDLAEIKQVLIDLASLENAVLESAVGTDAEVLVQDMAGRLLPEDDIMDVTEEEIDEYVEDQFWLELSDRLGRRDFLENVSEEDLDGIEVGEGKFPEGVSAYYEKYDKEFDKHGLDRLRVDGR